MMFFVRCFKLSFSYDTVYTHTDSHTHAKLTKTNATQINQLKN